MATIFATLTVRPGESPVVDFTIYEADGVTPQNITGWSLVFSVFATGAQAPFITKSTAAGTISLTNPTQGQGTITLASSDTAAVMPFLYSFKLERTDSGAGNDAWVTTGPFVLPGL